MKKKSLTLKSQKVKKRESAEINKKKDHIAIQGANGRQGGTINDS